MYIYLLVLCAPSPIRCASCYCYGRVAVVHEPYHLSALCRSTSSAKQLFLTRVHLEWLLCLYFTG